MLKRKNSKILSCSSAQLRTFGRRQTAGALALLLGVSTLFFNNFSTAAATSDNPTDNSGETANAIDLNADLKAYYNFENVSGATVPNLAQDALAGTLVGNGVSIVDTELGKSLHFTHDTESYMRVAQAINVADGPFSFALWYKIDTSFERNGKNMVLLQQNANGRSLLTLKAENKYHSYINAVDKVSKNAVEAGEWQHVIFAYDSSSKKLKFYINGILDSEQDAGANEVNALTDLYIGRHKNTGLDPFSYKGEIDEIRYYGKYVNDEEALAIYHDKATQLKWGALQAKITAAENLSASGKLENKEAAALELQAAINSAKQLTAANSLAKLDTAMQELESKMEAYNQAIRQTLAVGKQLERVIDKSIFGINHRYGFNAYGSFDSRSGKVKEEFAKLYQDSKFASIRYPGGTISNLFQWKNTIGPQAERVKQIHGFYNNRGQAGIAPNFGLDELGTFADEQGSEIVYVYGFGRGSAQDAADLVEYLNAPLAWQNANGGVDWAQVRANNGHPEPYNVRYFEIGNENNQGGTDGTTSQQYWTQFVDGGAEEAYIEGGLVKLNKQYAVLADNWNRAQSVSDGSAAQVRYMRYANPNPLAGTLGTELDDNFTAVVRDSVHVYVNDKEWQSVADLTTQTATAQVCMLDYRTGAIIFGDGVHGMIPPQGQTITVSYQVQRDGFVAIAKKMKETMAAINTAMGTDYKCYTYSSFETPGFVRKMQERAYNNYYDGLTIHPYSGNPDPANRNDNAAFYDQAMKLAETAGIKHVEDYVQMLPAGKVPVISEYGIFRSTNPLLRSQTHALYIAKVLMEYVRLGSPYIQKHCLVDWYSAGADSLGPTQQAVIQAVAQAGADTKSGEGEFKFFATPSALVFKMLNTPFAKQSSGGRVRRSLNDGTGAVSERAFGSRLLSATFQENDTLPNGVKALSALVTQDESGNYYAAVANVDRQHSKRLAIEFPDLAGYESVQVRKLLAADFSSENSLEHPDNIRILEESGKINKNKVLLDLEPHTFAVLKVNRAAEAPQPTETEVTPQPIESTAPTAATETVVSTQPTESVQPTVSETTSQPTLTETTTQATTSVTESSSSTTLSTEASSTTSSSATSAPPMHATTTAAVVTTSTTLPQSESSKQTIKTSTAANGNVAGTTKGQLLIINKQPTATSTKLYAVTKTGEVTRNGIGILGLILLLTFTYSLRKSRKDSVSQG